MASSFYNPPANCQVPDLGTKWETIFGRRMEGFFVEVGAYDGENFSNTSCLADAGWAGLYIEPIEEFAAKCRARHARNPRVGVLNCAASDTAGMAEIFVGDTLTTLVGEQVADYEKIDWARGLHRGERREIKTFRLDDLLEEQGVPAGFDVLVVDVEGAEDKVVSGFDIARWRPKVILIELEDEHPDFRDNTRVVSSVAAIRDKLEAAGYSVYFKDHINSLYVRRDIPGRNAGNVVPHPAPVPRVTIGLPTYNGANTIRRTLDSIANQTYTDFQLIISNNASIDETSKIIEEFRNKIRNISVLDRPKTVDVTTNFFDLVRQCETEFFVWIADDDWWESDFLVSCVERIDKNQSSVACFSDYRVFYHFSNQYSERMSYVPSTSFDPRLNFMTRISDMAPCAVYGVFRTYTLKQIIKRLPNQFDYSDIALTLAISIINGQLEIVNEDLFRAGVKSEATIQRRSVSGAKIQHRRFLIEALKLTREIFGVKAFLGLAPYVVYRIYLIWRYRRRNHTVDIEELKKGLISRDQIYPEGEAKPTKVAPIEPSTDTSAGYPPVVAHPSFMEHLSATVAADKLDLDWVQGFNQKARDAWVAGKAASVPAGSRVLDVGCGPAPYRKLFAHCDYKTHDFAQYEGYQDGFEGNYSQIDFVSDIVAIPVPDRSFDIILCTETLEHVPRPIDALAEMVRIVRPGGRLFLTAPLGSGLHQQPFHFYGGYTDHWYRKFLTEFGCDVVEITPNHGWFAHLAQECARFSWTYGKHEHLHGEQGPALSQFFGDTLARYLYAQDQKVFMPEFTVGFHVEAKRRLG